MNGTNSGAPVTLSAKVGEIVKKYMFDIGIVLASFVYIARAVLTISESGKTIAQIIGDGIIALIFGFVISRMMDFKGLLAGRNSDDYKNTLVAYSNIIDLITPKINKLDDWCAGQNEKALKSAQTAILRQVGIKYEDFISENFNLQTYDDEKRKIILKALKVKIQCISTRILTSESDNSLNRYDFAQTQKEYVAKSARNSAASRLGFAIVFGYYGVNLITNFSWAALVWYMVQSAVFIGLGIGKYMMAFFYITIDYRSTVIQKTNILYEFKNDMEELEQNDSIRHKAETSPAPRDAGQVRNVPAGERQESFKPAEDAPELRDAHEFNAGGTNST